MSFVKARILLPPTLSVSVSTDILRAGEELVVQVSTTNAFYTVLRTDEGKEFIGDPVYTFHVHFYVNQLRRAWINVTACGFYNTSKIVYVRLRFSVSTFPQDARETYYNSSDYARGYDMDNQRFFDLRGSWDVTWEFMKFGARYNDSIQDALYNGLGLKVAFAIEALLIWAKQYFSYFYQDGLNVSYTAYEIFQDFQGFDGENSTKDNFDPGRRYECSSMAAFISGIGLVMGLPARMVSLSDYTDTRSVDDDYQHMFAEIYGYNINGNNGWFLIDPARGYHTILSSYNDTNVVQSTYAYRDGDVKRLWVIWGMTSNGWGKNVLGLERQTSWIDELGRYIFQKAPRNSVYSNNPWNISVQQKP